MPTGNEQDTQQSNGQNGTQTNQTGAGETQAPTWDSWLAAQPETQRTTIAALYEAQTQGLRTALQSERQAKGDIEKQVRELQKGAEKGSDAEKRLNEMVSQLESANRRADFVTEAVKPEHAVADINAAWIIASAQADTYFDKRGNVNLALLKQNHPALFKGAVTPRANAGSGAGQSGGTVTMNDIIRQRAGRT